jgi:hypothetical protein
MLRVVAWLSTCGERVVFRWGPWFAGEGVPVVVDADGDDVAGFAAVFAGDVVGGPAGPVVEDELVDVFVGEVAFGGVGVAFEEALEEVGGAAHDFAAVEVGVDALVLVVPVAAVEVACGCVAVAGGVAAVDGVLGDGGGGGGAGAVGDGGFVGGAGAVEAGGLGGAAGEVDAVKDGLHERVGLVWGVRVGVAVFGGVDDELCVLSKDVCHGVVLWP